MGHSKVLRIGWPASRSGRQLSRKMPGTRLNENTELEDIERKFRPWQAAGRPWRQEGNAMTLWTTLLRTQESGWTILIRFMAGLAVFFPEGVQKLMFPDILGAGRFAKIGIPYPDLLGP